MKTDPKQRKANSYYNRFSRVYDLVSSKAYYHKARSRAIEELNLEKGTRILNVPVGTGQNFEYFQSYLEDTGLILGVDISPGMLMKAKKKIGRNNWSNIVLLNRNVLDIDTFLVAEYTKNNGFDAILCDLGLSGFPEWKKVIDTLVSLLSVNGRIAIMDWYIDKPTLRGEFIKWIGKGEVDRPLWQYLETKVTDFYLDASFNRGGVFVASGSRK
ncbi:MAG: methyltransferase [Chloroflexi bacterium]|nr:MAG: methyltransferase [Chloroflexota bacterium]